MESELHLLSLFTDSLLQSRFIIDLLNVCSTYWIRDYVPIYKTLFFYSKTYKFVSNTFKNNIIIEHNIFCIYMSKELQKHKKILIQPTDVVGRRKLPT